MEDSGERGKGQKGKPTKEDKNEKDQNKDRPSKDGKKAAKKEAKKNKKGKFDTNYGIFIISACSAIEKYQSYKFFSDSRPNSIIFLKN